MAGEIAMKISQRLEKMANEISLIEKELDDDKLEKDEREDLEAELLHKKKKYYWIVDEEGRSRALKDLVEKETAGLGGKKTGEKNADGQIEKDRGGYESAGEFFVDVWRDRGGAGRTKKMSAYIEKTVGSDEMNTKVDADGGIAIPSAYMDSLYARSMELSFFASRCFQLPIDPAVGRIFWPMFDDKTRTSTLFGGIQFYWTAERAQLTPSKPKLRFVKFEPNKLAGLMYVTNELMETSPRTVDAAIQQKFPQALAFIRDGVLLADGFGVGQPEAALNSPCALGIGAGAGSILRESANKITANDIIEMYSRFSGAEGAGIWVANRTAVPQLTKLMMEGVSSSIPCLVNCFTGPGLTAAPRYTIMGLPTYFSEHMQALGTAKDLALIDPGEYGYATRGGLKIANSIHVRFDYDETGFRFTESFDGHPMWDAALTPKHGSTLSPIIYLPSHA